MPLASLPECQGRARRHCGCRVPQPDGCTSPAQHSPWLRASGTAAVAAGPPPLLHDSTACHSTVHAVCPDLRAAQSEQHVCLPRLISPCMCCCSTAAVPLPRPSPPVPPFGAVSRSAEATNTRVTLCRCWNRRQQAVAVAVGSNWQPLLCAPAHCQLGFFQSRQHHVPVTSGSSILGCYPCCGGILVPVRSWAAAAWVHWLLWGRRHSGLPQQASCTAATPVRLPKAGTAARACCILGSWHGSIAKRTSVLCCRLREQVPAAGRPG